jgi:hypothetical protein
MLCANVVLPEPDAPTIPEALAKRPNPQSMQAELSALLRSLLPAAPATETDSPAR